MWKTLPLMLTELMNFGRFHRRYFRLSLSINRSVTKRLAFHSLEDISYIGVSFNEAYFLNKFTKLASIVEPKLVNRRYADSQLAPQVEDHR